MFTRIDQKLCNGCGRCIERCGMYVYARSEGKVFPRHPGRCVGCTLCVSGCPEHAITLLFPRQANNESDSPEGRYVY